MKIGSRANNEFRSTVAALKIPARLSRFHSWRLLAGVDYSLFKQTGNLADFDDAFAAERRALESWKQTVDAADDVYSQDLAFGVHAVGFSRRWKEECSLLGRDFQQLLVERTNAKGMEGAHHALISGESRPPKVQLAAAALAEPGRDFIASAQVDAPEGVSWIR